MGIQDIQNIIGYILTVGQKKGDIYQCQNEECESQVFNGHFYDHCDGDLREGYPC